MEDRVTLLLRRRDALVCCKCSKVAENQKVHMYMNVDYEIDKVLCEKCFEEEIYGNPGEELEGETK